MDQRNSCSVTARYIRTRDQSNLQIVGLTIIFSLGIVVTAATICRLSKAIAIIGAPPSELYGDRVEKLYLWSFVEGYLGTVIANIPALSALWGIARKRYKHSAVSASSRTPRSAPDSDQLYLRQEHGTNGSQKMAMELSARSADTINEEHILPRHSQRVGTSDE